MCPPSVNDIGRVTPPCKAQPIAIASLMSSFTSRGQHNNHEASTRHAMDVRGMSDPT